MSIFFDDRAGLEKRHDPHLAPTIGTAKRIDGEYFISETRFGPMVRAQLGIAEENSGKLVTRIRNTAREIEKEKGLNLILTDGPPGGGCSVIASLGGVDGIVAVTEPDRRSGARSFGKAAAGLFPEVVSEESVLCFLNSQSRRDGRQ